MITKHEIRSGYKITFITDERFRQLSANQCNLSTPKDVSVTHILVFPTSATAQVSHLNTAESEDKDFISIYFQSAVQAAFNDHQTGDNGENDFGFGIDMNDVDADNDELPVSTWYNHLSCL